MSSYDDDPWLCGVRFAVRDLTRRGGRRVRVEAHALCKGTIISERQLPSLLKQTMFISDNHPFGSM